MKTQVNMRIAGRLINAPKKNGGNGNGYDGIVFKTRLAEVPCAAGNQKPIQNHIAKSDPHSAYLAGELLIANHRGHDQAIRCSI